MNGLDLFSGIGGISIGLSQWVNPIAYCEADRFAQAVLLERMADGSIHSAPIWDDVRTLRGEMLPPLEIIYGGFPCQDISVAGNGKGLDGERSSLFFEIIRLTGEIRPRFVFLENVPAITIRGLERVCLEFTKIGYDCRWTIVSAAEVGAPHIRERWFLLAHARSEPMWIPEPRERDEKIYASSTLENGANSNSNCKRSQNAREGRYETQKPFTTDLLEGDTWDDYAAFFSRVDHGIPHRSHRIKAIGNSVVPIQIKTAFKRLMGL